ncbi:DUF1549 domain-containing protein [Singulisphaera sp. Ch08]|uniref:DUF1549 domain-containing protein n=1 Tax=Singulisphaera sp. Ch08 TaxID=3120278 RepID=A0AAU7CAW0_9BACT
MRFCPYVVVFLAFAVVGSPNAWSGESPDPSKLASAIDAKLAAWWANAHVQPAPIVDDATFLRRASLDLIGRPPTVAEAREFLSAPDPSAEKRAKLLNRLIDSGGHTRHMATFWRRAWVPQADTAEFARLADDFEAWVTLKLRDEAPYDRMVRELLTLDEVTSARPAGVSPGGFFAASEYKPENLAANASRGFLGVNLDCAQCHNHPFARWTREQFWQTAAFFETLKPGEGGKLMPPRLTIPNTEKSFTPAMLDGEAFDWPDSLERGTGRRLLAGWVTAPENPYFARNAVNRLWAQLYGAALVEPIDDLSGEGSLTGDRAELLGTLAEAFVASGYDLKYMTRALTRANAYQLSAAGGEGITSEEQLFARMPVRGLTGEQLYDSFRTAAGLPPERDDVGRGQGREGRKRFAAEFYIERPVAAERSITQALSIMNGRFTTELADPANNPTLAGSSTPHSSMLTRR